MRSGCQQARRGQELSTRSKTDRRARHGLKSGLLAVLIASCGRIGYDPLRVNEDAGASSGGQAGSASGGTSGGSAAGGGGSDSGTEGGGLAGAGGAGGPGTGGAGELGTGGAGQPGTGGAGQPGTGGAGGLMSVDSGVTTPSDSGSSGEAGADQSPVGDAGSILDAGPTPTCFDGLENQDETGVDCGGASCVPCLCAFGAPQLLGNPNASGNDAWSPTFSSDGLTMYFSLTVPGFNERIAVTTRPDRGNTFGPTNTLPAPVNTSNDGTPELSQDGLSLYFFKQGSGNATARDLYVATRASTAAQFNTVRDLTTLNSSRRDDRPWVSPDELTVYFTSQRASTSDDLWRATRNTRSDPFGTPVVVTELNSTGNDAGIVLTPDGLVALFASDRSGGRGGVDIYRAVRARTSDPFSTPDIVPELSSTADDFDVQLTADGQEVFFASNRNSSNYRLWRSLVTCP
jgi:hypothetical protein